MCKHVAATLYGVGVRLDDDPILFFKLRGVNVEALISETITEQTKPCWRNRKRKAAELWKRRMYPICLDLIWIEH